MLQKSRAKKGRGGGAAFFVIYTFLCAPFTVTNTWEKKNHIKMTYNTVVYKCNML